MFLFHLLYLIAHCCYCCCCYSRWFFFRAFESHNEWTEMFCLVILFFSLALTINLYLSIVSFYHGQNGIRYAMLNAQCRLANNIHIFRLYFWTFPPFLSCNVVVFVLKSPQYSPFVLETTMNLNANDTMETIGTEYQQQIVFLINMCAHNVFALHCWFCMFLSTDYMWLNLFQLICNECVYDGMCSYSYKLSMYLYIRTHTFQFVHP